MSRYLVGAIRLRGLVRAGEAFGRLASLSGAEDAAQDVEFDPVGPGAVEETAQAAGERARLLGVAEADPDQGLGQMGVEAFHRLGVARSRGVSVRRSPVARRAARRIS
jgi:hypothetical protein